MSEIIQMSDLVIVGRIVGLYIGEEWELEPGLPYPLAYLRVEIVDTLKGEPASREPGRIEIQMGFARGDLDAMRAAIPAHDHLLFLRLEDPADRGPENQSSIAGFAYSFTDYPQTSVLRNINGVVEVIRPDAIARALSPRQFPVPLDGTDFGDLVERVREQAGGSAAAVGARAVQSRPRDAGGGQRFAC